MEFGDITSNIVNYNDNNEVCTDENVDNPISGEVHVNGITIGEIGLENPGASANNCIINGFDGNQTEIKSNLLVTVTKTPIYKSPSFSDEGVVNSIYNIASTSNEETNICKNVWDSNCQINGRKRDLVVLTDECEKVKNNEPQGATGGCDSNLCTASLPVIDFISPELDFLEFDFEEQNASGDEENSGESRSQTPPVESELYMASKRNDLGEPSGLQRNYLANSLSFQNLTTSPKFCNSYTRRTEIMDTQNVEDTYSDNTDSDSGNLDICNVKESCLFNISNEEMDWDEYNVQSALLCSYNSKNVEGKKGVDSQENVSQALHVKETSNETGLDSITEKVMIWSEMEACSRQVTQIGKSACGATAVINTLMALNIPFDNKNIENHINTRYRAETAPVVQYLLSRSTAGTTHEELILGVNEITKGEVYGRFFHMFPERNVQLLPWLSSWIKKGAIPIATLNLQCGLSFGQSIPDSWHHQMIFGVGPKGVYLTNPLEYIPIKQFKQQTCSESVLLVRRSDVISRWDGDYNLTPLILGDAEWRELNVLGQIVNILRESTNSWTPGHRRYLMSHVKIPAAYKSGVTLFVHKDSGVYKDLVSSPELAFANNV